MDFKFQSTQILKHNVYVVVAAYFNILIISSRFVSIYALLCESINY